MSDPTKYRCTLQCRCNTDAAVGFGETPEAAEAAARVHWKRGRHRLRDIADKILEQAVEHSGGGSHYEELVS